MGIKEANSGGRSSMMLARLGIRALIFEGKAPSKTLILIDEEGIKFHSAEEYSGLGNYELHSRLKAKYGQKIGIYSIGPAGEFMYKNSTVAINDLEGYPSRHAARGGLGAVMGSKNVKAIVVLPSKTSRVKIHDLKKFREVIKPFVKRLAETKETFSIYGTALAVKLMSELGGLPTQNFRKGSYEHADKISGEKLHDLLMTRGGKNRLPCCPTCVIKCSNLFVDEKGKYHLFKKEDLEFRYRYSPFQEKQGAIVAASFRLKKDLDSKEKQADLILERKKKQPFGQKSAGCAFINPESIASAKLIESGIA